MAEHREVVRSSLNHTLHGTVPELPRAWQQYSERNLLNDAPDSRDIEYSSGARIGGSGKLGELCPAPTTVVGSHGPFCWRVHRDIQSADRSQCRIVDYTAADGFGIRQVSSAPNNIDEYRDF